LLLLFGVRVFSEDEWMKTERRLFEKAIHREEATKKNSRTRMKVGKEGDAFAAKPGG
jgi:hypothetical protein